MRKPVRIDRASGGRPPGPGRVIPRQTPPTANQQNSAFGQGCGLLLAVILVLLLIGKCSSGSSDAPSNPVGSSAPEAALSEPAYVAARSLNCRREPEASATVSETLRRNEQVVVAERRGEWARLTRIGGDCWVSNSFLSGAAGGSGNAAGSASRNAQGLISTGVGSSVAAAGAGYVASKAVKSGKRRGGSRHRGSSGRRRGGGGGYFGSGCPCSGSQVCIGPRGGRYCITSGGNKRYGV